MANVRRAFHADDLEALNKAWEQGLAESVPFSVELRLRHQQSGDYRFVNLRAVPNLDEEGRVLEWIGAISDIHARREAEEEVHSLNAELEQRVAVRTEQLEEVNRELESFSYSVSHDLRAPVRAVAGFSRILAKDHSPQLDSEGHRLLNIIQSEAARMGALIDDLLAFSRLGRKALQPIQLDMQSLASTVFDSLMANHTEIHPEVRMGSLPAAQGDRSLLVQVWSNLLANAVKFSSKVERPVIEVGAISEEDEHVYFVRDNGAGFDPRYKAKLFGVFQRLHDASEFTGTGVGLALVQRIVTRHGGRVWADGAPGKGATFYFTLPRDTDNGSA
jgi:light-regulated signal transduction histidine kinase (bacteriophytochrome)